MDSTRGIEAPPVVTTDSLYLRLIGHRSIQEKDFGRIQIDRVVEMQKWVDNVKTLENESIRLAILIANNHYAGFGPGTVNIFRNMLGLPQAEWKEMKEEEKQEQCTATDSKQRALSDFFALNSHGYTHPEDPIRRLSILFNGISLV